MKRIPVILLLGFLPVLCEAQVYAFAPGVAGGDGSDGAKVSAYKVNTAQRVFDALLRARADFRMQSPTLSLSKKEGHIACFLPDKLQVVLDEKAYDLCATFGKDSLNALAALLSHELIHYYEKHDWNRHFARENEHIGAAKRLENMEEGLKQETQADCLGGFMAFSVGYNTYGIMPELLKKAYKAYDLPEQLPGYPDLADRVAMVNSAMAQLQALQLAYETANLLTVLERYADASAYYTYILTTYQSREVYNNAGVNAALAALRYYEPVEMPYALPLELDPQSRLFSLKNNDLEKINRRKMLLNVAQEQFERAALLDPDYLPAYLNKACVLALKSEWEDAEYTLRKGKKKASDAQYVANFEVLEGVIAALQKDSATAVKHWTSAEKKGSLLAGMNLATLRGKASASPPPVMAAKGVEAIEQFSLGDFMKAPATDREVKIAEKIFCGLRQLKASKVLIHYADDGQRYAFVQETLPGYTGRSLAGVALGDTKEKIVTAYGRPPRSTAMPGGAQVWIYPEPQIFFRFDTQAKLSSWGVYRKSDF